MSEKPIITDEERRINRRSFIIGIFIGMGFIVLFVVLFYLGLIQ